MSAELQRFLLINSPQTKHTNRTCKFCRPSLDKTRLSSRQMSLNLVLPQPFDSGLQSQFCSLPVLTRIVPHFPLKIGEQNPQWVRNSDRVSLESSEQSMSDTSDYFSSSPSTSKELYDSDYDSGQEWTYLSLNELFSPGDPKLSSELNSTPVGSSSTCPNTTPLCELSSASCTSRPTFKEESHKKSEVKDNNIKFSIKRQSKLGATCDLPKEAVPQNKSKATDDLRTRVLDEDGFIRRAACVCLNEDESKVMLITSKTDPEGWLIPGGGLEANEPEDVAAQREAWEEAGVRGQILRCLGTFKSDDELTNKKKRTTVFVLKVTEECHDFPEAITYGRRRGWFSIEDAIDKLKRCKKNQILYLRSL